MTDKKIIVQFTMLTFCIAYVVSGALIILGQFGLQLGSLVTAIRDEHSFCNLYFVTRYCFIYRSEEE